jgi:hypothetical protein
MSVWRRYGYAWVTLALFLLSLTSHWVFGWFAYVDEQQAHDAPVEVSSYLNEMARDTLENWQSEFLQLLWQVGGLALPPVHRLAAVKGGERPHGGQARCDPAEARSG